MGEEVPPAREGRGQGRPGHGRLNNLSEFRSKTNPHKADSNGNGVGDASEDQDHDGVDNGNEAREHTNPCKGDSDGDGVKDGKEDADKDQLNNGGEDQAGTDPINPDSDGDGIKDGDEKAGEVVSFDGTTLTVRVFGGQTLTGTVDENTWIDGCGTDSSSSSGDDSWWDDSNQPSTDELKVRAHAHLEVDPGADDPSADDPSSDDPSGDDPSGDDGSADPGFDDGSGDDSSFDDGSGCTADVLKPGVEISEADLSATSDGVFFDTIELKSPATP